MGCCLSTRGEYCDFFLILIVFIIIFLGSVANSSLSRVSSVATSISSLSTSLSGSSGYVGDDERDDDDQAQGNHQAQAVLTYTIDF